MTESRRRRGAPRCVTSSEYPSYTSRLSHSTARLQSVQRPAWYWGGVRGKRRADPFEAETVGDSSSGKVQPREGSAASW